MLLLPPPIVCSPNLTNTFLSHFAKKCCSYRRAFDVIATSSAFFAGFAFNGLLMTPYVGNNPLRPVYMTTAQIQRFQFTLNSSCALTIVISVCTMLYCKFLTLFATRFALRGGRDAVEHAVVNLRREYRGCIYALTVSQACNQ